MGAGPFEGSVGVVRGGDVDSRLVEWTGCDIRVVASLGKLAEEDIEAGR